MTISRTENNQTKEQVPLVSILCATFNHVDYIKDCLDGFLMQKVSFPIEIIVRDDASTDGTSEIIRRYEEKHPHLFRNIYESKNQYSKGIKALPVMKRRARGKYVALCEGDDYWTDPDKLQKQVNFLEKNKGYSLCFHAVSKIEANQVLHEFPSYDLKEAFGLVDLFTQWFIPTASILFKNNIDFRWNGQ